MGLIRKILPKGVDEAIDSFQKQIYDNISWAAYNYDCHPRSYKNEALNGLTYELFYSGVDYKDAFYDDKIDCKSFFIVDDDANIQNFMYKTEVTLIVQMDLSKCYPTVTHRADEEAHQELRRVVGSNPYGFKSMKLITGVSNVLKSINIDPVKYTDMQPRHLFAITFELNYKCCSC